MVKSDGTGSAVVFCAAAVVLACGVVKGCYACRVGVKGRICCFGITGVVCVCNEPRLQEVSHSYNT
jgi:hypothetical protein